MNRIVSHYISTRRLWLALLIALFFLAIAFQVVWATTTPQVCDFFQKYGCSKVAYNSQGGGILITDRLFRGAIDGGADKWQIYWTKDWEYISGSWVFREKWGPGSWRYHVNLSPWFGWANDDRNRITNSAVQFKFRYYECVPGNCYYWCSATHEHYLWNNTSAEVGTGVCTQ